MRIATLLSQRALAVVRAATQGRLVHHVVVVERGDVGQLHDAGGRVDRVGVGVRTGLSGEQHEQRSEALATGHHQVRRGLRDELRTPPAVVGEHHLDARHPLDQPLLESGVDDGHCKGRVGHLMNSPATAARSSTGPGSTPRTRVIAAPTAMVVAVSTDGYATLGPSPIGLSKYMTLMTRT